MSGTIVEPNGDGSALVYPDEKGVTEDDKRVLSVREVFDELGAYDVQMMFEGSLTVTEDADPQTGDPAVLILPDDFDVLAVLPYENYTYEKRRYKDGTGPLIDSVRLQSGKGYVMSEGERLFPISQWSDGGKWLKRKAENYLENHVMGR